MAVALGTLFFNKGRFNTLNDTLITLGHQVTENMRSQWIKIDSHCSRYRKNKNKPRTMKRRKELKHKNVKTVKGFLREEGEQYKSGQFHGEGSDKKKRKTSKSSNPKRKKKAEKPKNSKAK